MAQRAPGQHYRKGLSIIEITDMFPDNAAAERWFVETRWPDGVRCPRCDSDNVQERSTRKPQPYRCRACRKDFSVKVGTLMQGSKLGLRTWALAYYLLATNIKGISSMKLRRDLGVTQKTAWHLSMRIRETWDDDTGRFAGPVEVDEAYFGGKERNKHESKKLRAGRGPVGKMAVVGAKDRATGKVSAAVVERTDGPTLRGFVADRTTRDAKVYTDEHAAYRGLPNHESVTHSVGEYVRDQAHTNGVESFWSLLKRGYYGTYHRMSAKHLGRYVNEFAGRHNQRPKDTIAQMRSMVRGMSGKRLRYKDLIRPTGASAYAGEMKA